MKKIITLVFIVVILIYIPLKAEQKRDLSLGPYLSLKAGVNGGNTMDGRKNGVAFTGIPDFGLQLFYPLSFENDLGMICDLGLSSYAYFIDGVNVNKEYILTYRYLTLSPSFYFSIFSFGFAFGIQVAADFGE